MSQEDKTLAAIQILTQAKEETAELLKDTPMLSIRVENTMGLLIRGINHASGFNPSSAGETLSTTPQQMVNFYGLDVEEIKKQEVPAVVVITKSDKELYMERIKDLYEDFLNLEDKAIVESVPKVDVLGIAKLAGITVDNPASQNITQTFVKQIKKAIQEKNDTEDARKAELEKLNGAGEGSKTAVNLKKETDKDKDPAKDSEGGDNQQAP